MTILNKLKESTINNIPFSWDDPSLFVRTDQEVKDIFKRSLENNISFQEQLDLDNKKRVRGL